MPHQQRSHPRKYGKDSRACRVTGQNDGLIRKYGLNMSRQCFREQANQIGFFKMKWAMIWNTRKTWREYTESRPELNLWSPSFKAYTKTTELRSAFWLDSSTARVNSKSLSCKRSKLGCRTSLTKLLTLWSVIEYGIYLVLMEGTPSLDTTILDTS